MNQLGFPLLSAIILLPFAGALVTLLLGHNRTVIKVWALIVVLVDLALACILLALFDYGVAEMQFVDHFAWIEPLGISYTVGVDGISLWLLLLTAFLSPIVVLVSWGYLEGRAESEARSFIFFLLVLQTGVLGVFAALDLVLFYVLWEAVLIPAYFLIGRWGGERRAYAALKFFLYTMAGSALMLVGIIALAVLNFRETGLLTFDLLTLYKLPLPWLTQMGLFLAFALAFAVKAPIWPLHTWLPDAYEQSPTPVTVVLAAVLSKMAVYGLIRFCLPLFPDAVAALRPWIWLLAIVGILYGSLVALAQKDMKRLVAFSSLAHMGMIIVGVFAVNAQGVSGALVLSVSHGLTVSALFVLVGMLERRRGTRQIDAFGGLWKSIPLLGSLLLAVVMASIGLPGLSGFPGEFTLLVGVFQESIVAAAFATLGIVMAAWYMLSFYRHAFAGPLVRSENRILPDLRRHEAVILVPLLILILLVGIVPNLVFYATDDSVDLVLGLADERSALGADDLEQASWFDPEDYLSAKADHRGKLNRSP